MRWKDPMALSYAGIPAEMSPTVPFYKPVPILSDGEGSLDEKESKIENEEPLRRVQLETSALHPEIRHDHHDHHR